MSDWGHAFRAFQHRSFTIFWFGAMISNAGTWLANIAVPVVVYMLTESAMWVGIAAACQFGATALIGPWGGAIADRFRRKYVLIGAQAAMGLGACTIWLTWSLGVRDVWALLIPLTFQGLANGISMPAWQAIVNDLVPREDLRSAVTFNSMQFNLGRTIGPAAGGLLLASFEPSLAFLINTLCFAVALAAFACVNPLYVQPRLQRIRAWAGFVQALGMIYQTPSLRLSVVLAVSVGFLGNPLFNMTVVFANEVYHVGPVALSMLGVALGLGAILAAPIVSGWPVFRSLGRTAKFGFGLYGTSLIVLALVPQYWVGIVALLAAGVAFLATNSSANTALQLNAGGETRGRVISARITLFTASMPLGALAQSFLADTFGVQWSTGLAGLCFLLVLIAIEMPPRRRRFTWLDQLPH